jgi:thioesterase domain-containing protein
LLNLESHTPCATTIEALTEIWQRVLRRTNIGPDEEFHDLGGNDQFADKLFAEIAEVFNRQLPTATITHATTIAALAALLEQHTLPVFPPIVKLKAGSEKTPVFIAHGLDGRARFWELAKNIRTDHAIYGFQARGVDGLEEPFERIEEMAAYYLEALDKFQPVGPYLLIGYSFGGLITLEMAQRLAEAGKQVALLVLIDAYPHPRYLTPGPRLRLMARRVWRHISEMTHRPPHAAFVYFMKGLKHRLHLAGVRNPDEAPPESSPLSYAQTTLRVRYGAYRAYGSYRPRFYRGKISFVRAQSGSYFPDNPTPIWSRLAEEFEVETVPGDHLDMVTARFEHLAAVVTDYLRRAREQE